MHPNVHDQSQTAAFLWLRGHPQRFSSPIRCVCVFFNVHQSSDRLKKPTKNGHENPILYSIGKRGGREKVMMMTLLRRRTQCTPPVVFYTIPTPLTLVCVWIIISTYLEDRGRTSADRSFRFHYGGTREKKNQINKKKIGKENKRKV